MDCTFAIAPQLIKLDDHHIAFVHTNMKHTWFMAFWMHLSQDNKFNTQFYYPEDGTFLPNHWIWTHFASRQFNQMYSTKWRNKYFVWNSAFDRLMKKIRDPKINQSWWYFFFCCFSSTVSSTEQNEWDERKNLHTVLTIIS